MIHRLLRAAFSSRLNQLPLLLMLAALLSHRTTQQPVHHLALLFAPRTIQWQLNVVVIGIRVRLLHHEESISLPFGVQDALVGCEQELPVAATDQYHPSRHIAQLASVSLGCLFVHHVLDAGDATVNHALATRVNLEL
jgi:hypothetical protein